MFPNSQGADVAESSGLDGLLSCAGEWVGRSRLQDPHADEPDESASTLRVVPILRGRFVRLDYTWAYRGEPQEGSMLLGFRPEASEVTAHWVDGWHVGHDVMVCRGVVGEDGRLDVRGTYSVPSAPDWGWRMVIVPGRDRLTITMYNVAPEGEEYLAVEGDYRRKE